MDIRPLSDRYAVSPQIDPADVPAIQAAGYTTIICNRPNLEIPPSHHAEVLKASAEAAGLGFVELPVTHQTMSLDLAAQQKAAIDASDGPVLAYCASGTRSSIVWALGQASEMSSNDIITAAAKAGYDLGGMRPTLDNLRQG